LVVDAQSIVLYARSPWKEPTTLFRGDAELKQKGLSVIGLPGLPTVVQGDCIADLIVRACSKSGAALHDRDVLVIASTIVSKSEGQMVRGDDVSVSAIASRIAGENGFDPIQVELALRESTRVIRSKGVLILERKDGLVCNFAGVDKSNAPEGFYLLLPKDADASADRIRSELEKKTGLQLAIVVSDTQGRPWRRGIVNLAVGCAGMGAFKYNVGKSDLYGRVLEHSLVCRADELAATAEPIMGQAGQGIPVVIVRGLAFESGPDKASDISRRQEEDLFR